jgi:hypothetical protein
MAKNRSTLRRKKSGKSSTRRRTRRRGKISKSLRNFFKWRGGDPTQLSNLAQIPNTTIRKRYYRNTLGHLGDSSFGDWEEEDYVHYNGTPFDEEDVEVMLQRQRMEKVLRKRQAIQDSNEHIKNNLHRFK